MREADLRAWMQAALEARGVSVDPESLPVQQLQAVLRRLEALDGVDLSGEEPGPLRWDGL
ncbi:MAG: hypothetical protein QN188_05355 [Armatimonadota bacterium]|nr:hypothetical protein [Armatimonadota bacterium]MDR5676631.1 hypothetical protein [Armatimonadota bacterium]MDR5690003.1 hypothetical protein [Armatimonadota bacterium]MDR7387048.1 hypothetical protein [Armatimonadota bacterium]MDR7389062.1 hypothetical protein [Armatimonadota bacterium]